MFLSLSSSKTIEVGGYLDLWAQASLATIGKTLDDECDGRYFNKQLGAKLCAFHRTELPLLIRRTSIFPMNERTNEAVESSCRFTQ